MATFNKTDLFVIVSDWFDEQYYNPDLVYTDIAEAEIAADYIRGKSLNSWKVEVLNIYDFGSYCDEKGSERASYD